MKKMLKNLIYIIETVFEERYCDKFATLMLQEFLMRGIIKINLKNYLHSPMNVI
jgi:hypothetical protein